METKKQSLQQQIYESMDLKTTQELLEIWVANDRNARTETAFATIKGVLQNRNVEVPEQHIQNGDIGLEGDRATLSAETQSTAQAHFNQSYALWNKSRFREALEQCNQALALAPGWSEAHNLRGVILEEMQQIGQSILEYRKAIQLNPMYKDAQENLAYAKESHPAIFKAMEKPAGAASLPQDAAQKSLSGLKCPVCGGAVAATDTYCKHCGAHLAEPGPTLAELEEMGGLRPPGCIGHTVCHHNHCGCKSDIIHWSHTRTGAACRPSCIIVPKSLETNAIGLQITAQPCKHLETSPA